MPRGESEDNAIFLSISCPCLSFNEKERERESRSERSFRQRNGKRTKEDSRRRINIMENWNEKFSRKRNEVECFFKRIPLIFLRSLFDISLKRGKRRKRRYREKEKVKIYHQRFENLGLNRRNDGNSIGDATVTSVAAPTPAFSTPAIFSPFIRRRKPRD